MSRENVEIARRVYEAFNRGDLDGMVADFAPTFEYVTTGTVPGVESVYRGPEGWMEFMDWFWGEFERPRVEIRELIEAGDHVLASLSLAGRGKQSGVNAGWDVWHVWTVQYGEVVRGRDSRAGTKPSKPPGYPARPKRYSDGPAASRASSRPPYGSKYFSRAFPPTR